MAQSVVKYQWSLQLLFEIFFHMPIFKLNKTEQQIQTLQSLKFKIVTEVIIKTLVCFDMTPCSMADNDQYTGETSNLILPVVRSVKVDCKFL
jgi:hypothetical protein